MSQLKVEVIVGLVNRLSGGLRGMQRDLRRFGRDASMIGASMTYGGQQIVESFRGAVDASNTLQSELTEVAIVAGQSVEAVAALRPELRAIARESVQPMQALAEAMSGMTAKGLGWDQARAALPEIARAATASRAQLGDLESVAASIISQLGIDPGKLADPFNRLAAAANAGGFELRDMAQYLPEVTAAMAKLDTGERAVTNLGAALQIVRKGAGSAGQAATQLTDLLEKMVSPAVVGALDKKFGVDLPAAMGKWKAQGLDPLAEFVGLMQRTTGGDAFKIAEVFGDKEARAGIVSLMRNWSEFEAIRAKVAAAPGQDLIGQMFATRTGEDPIIRLQQLTISVQTLADQIGGALTPVLSDLVGKVQPLVATVGQWIENNRELAGTIALWVAGLGAAMAILGPVLIGFGAVAFAVSLMAAPFWLTVAAIAAVALALGTLYLKWDAVVAYLTAQKDALFAVGRDLIDGLWRGIQERWQALKDKVAGIARSITNIFRQETDTHSPSRVFQAIGGDLMRGLAIGIDRAAGLPLAQVGRAAAGVVAGAGLALGGVAQAAAAPVVHMPITITINAPAGMDASGLAALVRKEVSEAARQATGRLGALYDQGDGL